MRLYANGINLKHLNAAHRAMRLCFILSGETNEGHTQSGLQPCPNGDTWLHLPWNIPVGLKESVRLPIPVKYVVFD